MADKNALEKIGMMLCTATVLVTMIGAVVVNSHLSGRLQIDDSLRMVELPTAVR